MRSTSRLVRIPALPALLLPVLALVAYTSPAVASTGGNQSDVIAQGGRITLDDADIRELVASLPAQTRSAVTSSLESLQQVVQADIVRRAVIADARSSGFDRQPQTLAQLQQVQEQALARLWIASKATVPADYPSAADLQAAYDDNRKALTAPTQYHIAQIFISAPDGADPAKLEAALRKAEAIAPRIAGSDFAQLASAQSEDPSSASRGGDLGYLPEDRIMPVVLNAVRSLKPGEVVGPIKTPEGLRFLKLLDRKPGAVPTLAQAHDTLVALLRARRAAQLERAYLAAYSAKLGVTVNQIELARLQQTLPR